MVYKSFELRAVAVVKAAAGGREARRVDSMDALGIGGGIVGWVSANGERRSVRIRERGTGVALCGGGPARDERCGGRPLIHEDGKSPTAVAARPGTV